MVHDFEPSHARLAGDPCDHAVEVVLVISGASGMSLATGFARTVLRETDTSMLHLVVTEGATAVLRHELGGEWASARALRERLDVAEDQRRRITAWSNSNLAAPIASGSHPVTATVVLPCSAGMVGAVAGGLGRGLAQRVADVALKERRSLVLGLRETPMSAILLENCLKLVRAGAHVVPPLPAFYLKPDETSAFRRFIDHYSMRVLDLVGLPTKGAGLRWGD